MSTTEFAAVPTGERPVVVTGASAGIGEASARALAALGHPVVLGARRTEVCDRIAADIRAVGGTAHAVRLDLGDVATIDSFAKQAEDLVGGIDVLVSNAGFVQPGEVLTADQELLEQHLQINVIGTRRLVQLLGAAMVSRGRGDLVFVTSEVLRAPRPGIGLYVTAKYAVEGMVSVLALELEGTGVRVSTIRPGATMTEMGWDWEPAVTAVMYADWEQRGIQRHDNFMLPSDVAAAVTAVVGAPPGVVFRVLEVEPIAPHAHTDSPTERTDR
jgi:NAD(P)-dependent dehydrogenase (short-subunit alcohol dehydrogenase family)